MSHRMMATLVLGLAAGCTSTMPENPWQLQTVQRTAQQTGNALTAFRSLPVIPPAAQPAVPSLLEYYADLEEKILRELKVPESGIPSRAAMVVTLANKIASDVSETAMRETEIKSRTDAIRSLSKRRYAEIIAAAIKSHGVYYHEESLLSRSFNSEHTHLDCDQLVYLFCHVGGLHRVVMYPVFGTDHTYLSLSENDGSELVVEATAFNEPASMLSSHDLERSTRGSLSWLDIQSLGLYRPETDRTRIQRYIRMTILTGIQDYAAECKDIRLMEDIHREYSAMIRKGPANHILMNNCFILGIQIAEVMCSSGNFLGAKRYCEDSKRLRESAPELIMQRPLEDIYLARILNAAGDYESAECVFRVLRNWYDTRLRGNLFGTSDLRDSWYARFLTYLAEFELQGSRLSAGEIYETMIYPAYQIFSQYPHPESFEEFSWIKERKEEFDE